MNQMFVAGIGLEQRSGQPMVLLHDHLGERVLPIAIGVYEAKAISKALQGVRSKRPDTHELLKECVSAVGFEAHHVFIDCGPGDAYQATISLMPSKSPITNDVLEIDARPSDAITMALLYDAPIMLSDKIMSRASMPLKDDVDDEETTEQFKDFLQNIKASDFNKYGGAGGSGS